MNTCDRILTVRSWMHAVCTVYEGVLIAIACGGFVLLVVVVVFVVVTIILCRRSVNSSINSPHFMPICIFIYLGLYLACVDLVHYRNRAVVHCSYRWFVYQSLGPFYGAIAVPSVTRCRCRRCRRCCGHRCAGGVRQ